MPKLDGDRFQRVTPRTLSHAESRRAIADGRGVRCSSSVQQCCGTLHGGETSTERLGDHPSPPPPPPTVSAMLPNRYPAEAGTRGATAEVSIFACSPHGEALFCPSLVSPRRYCRSGIHLPLAFRQMDIRHEGMRHRRGGGLREGYAKNKDSIH